MSAEEQPEWMDDVIAAVDLIGRTGAKHVEIGYLNDDPPHDWWAKATYKGSSVFVENEPSPSHALDALLVRLLDGARCFHCKRKVTNDPTRNKSYYCMWWKDEERWTSRCTEENRRER